MDKVKISEEQAKEIINFFQSDPKPSETFVNFIIDKLKQNGHIKEPEKSELVELEDK